MHAATVQDRPGSASAFGCIAKAPGADSGSTELAAPDAALLDAGVANHNLRCVSSVNPPGSRLETLQIQRSLPLGPAHAEICCAVCERGPECALVIAVHGSEPW